ncbi:hypothetical protein [Bacillus wiedmannii]|uniref:hypothetical protein n=1 Tax=Bacillus wiedmannii TaxID=1890302 RepID=UPI000B453909|nr:hypothetical protein [Bacillus wiedmannii]OUB79407.1 hypothetical protein BK788_29895 [Bacillus thuringiensis serovar sinensis]
MIKKIGIMLLITGLLGGCTLSQEEMKSEPKAEKSNPMEPDNRKEDDKPKAGTVKDIQMNEDGSHQEVEVDENAKPVDSIQK